jgi:CheY-like chemotaxis protein
VTIVSPTAPEPSGNDALAQALISKGVETVQLSNALRIAPQSAHARSRLTEQLRGLQQAAAQLGLVHLENALGDAVVRLEREGFAPEALDAVRELAGRYVSLAAMPAGSGTHPAVVGEGEESGTRASLRARRILVAIADAPARWSYVGILREAGARVTEARDGLEGLELARGEPPPELILADLIMPGLDGLGLCAAIRREPSLDAVPVVLLSARPGEPPQALSEAGTGPRALVDALLGKLGLGHAAAEQPRSAEEDHPRPERAEAGTESHRALRGTGPTRESARMIDRLERENIRAQAAVAMHKEPANRARRSSYPVWRLSLGPGSTAGALSSGFDAQVQMISRVLGVGFIALVAGTAALLLWSAWSARTPAARSILVEPSEAAAAPEQTAIETEAPERPQAPPAVEEGLAGLTAFSGELRADVAVGLEMGEGEGVLELDGPAEVTVAIDGIEHGPLPVKAVLAQGRHTVRYQLGSRATYRFYVVKPGATRVLRVVTRPGGLIDAR